jgi:hypothetical protein
MSVEQVIRTAGQCAQAALYDLTQAQDMAEAEFLSPPLEGFIAFYVRNLPPSRPWQQTIQEALPFLRGSRSSRGLRFAGCCFGCAHEALLGIVEDLHRFLRRHETFRQIALHLNNKCLDLFPAGVIQWQHAVQRFVLAECFGGSTATGQARSLAEAPMYEHPFWRECEAIYRRLVSRETFFQKTFAQVVLSFPPTAYHALGKEFGNKAREFDLEELRRQIQWEASRALLLTSASSRTAGQGATPPPPPASMEDKPHWDAERGELWYGGEVVKKFKQPAPNARTILSAFQEQEWPPRIDDPLPQGRGSIVPRQRLADTLRGLKCNQAGLIFEQDGTGEGVIWTSPAKAP